MDQNDLKYTLALSQIPGIGCIRGKNLITFFGSAEKVFRELPACVNARQSLKDLIRMWEGNKELWKRTEDELRFIEKYKLNVLTFNDEGYPWRLADCYDSPLYLFYKGNADLNAAKVVGIVGTRSATDYGKGVTKDLVAGLAGEEPLIVSGLAYGIDYNAHRAALDYGLSTVGVLGHGLDVIYPSNNKSTAEQMLKQGGLVTEFFSKTRPDRENFPMRNRILAGLCDAIVVVEAALKGGALVTADIASTYGRSVFVIPGRVTDRFSGGCNLLAKIKKAETICNADDLVYEMGWKDRVENPPTVLPKLFVPLSKEEEQVVEILQSEGDLTIDEISRKSKLQVNRIAVALLNLELENVVRSKPGKLYSLSCSRVL